MKKNILVIGGTGMLGKPVVLQLAQNPQFSVTLGSRKRPDWLPEEVKWIHLELASPDSIAAALLPGAYLYLNLSVDPSSRLTDFQPEREGLNNILAAAKKIGVSHICYLSSLIQRQLRKDGSAWWVASLKEQAVAAIKNSGLGYTIFYGSTFMETIPFRFLKKDTITLAGRLPFPTYWIAAEDYARQVEAAIRMSTPTTHKTYTVQGPQKLRVDEALQIFAKNYSKGLSGKSIKVKRVPLQLLALLGLVSRKMRYMYELLHALDRFEEQPDHQATWQDLGEPSITFFCVRYLTGEG